MTFLISPAPSTVTDEDRIAALRRGLSSLRKVAAEGGDINAAIDRILLDDNAAATAQQAVALDY